MMFFRRLIRRYTQFVFTCLHYHAGICGDSLVRKMVHFVSLTCIMVIIFTSYAFTAKSKSTNMRWVETRLKTLESRLNIEAMKKEEEYEHIAESILNLNLTIINLYDIFNDNGVHQSTDETVCCDKEFEIRITTAFEDEKHSIRKTIESLSKHFKENQQQQQSRSYEISLVRREATAIRREFQDRLQRTRLTIERYKSDGQSEVSALRNEVNDILNKQESQINECFETLKEMKRAKQKMIPNMTKTNQETVNNNPKQQRQSANEESLQTCQYGWEMYNDFCYRYFSDNENYAAKADCAKFGAHLVDVQDKAEDDFVNTLHNSTVIWIGLRKHGLLWKWDRTGNVATYTNWLSGLPMKSGRERDCVVVGLPNLGRWFDTNCDHSFGYVCKEAI